MLLHWHRSDLRATDNTALSAAATEDTVLPVFVFDDAVLEHGSPNRVSFMLDSLQELRAWYRERGGDLYVTHGDPSSVLPDLCAELEADGVVWNADYSGLARERDRAVTAALEDEGLRATEYEDALHHEPGSITTNAGDPYSVYTYFWKKWRDREKDEPRDAPDTDRLEAEAGEALSSLSELGFEEPTADIEPAGMDAARNRLEAFCDGPVFEYDEKRDYPAGDHTSRLSAHLRWGTIGPREVYAATEDAMEAAESEEERENVEAFQSQLAWREFYHHVLYFHPHVVTENYNEYQEGIDWRDDAEEIQAWKEGKTGYPIVDAGMRELRETGHMHNRVRMIVASFLTKDLLADWRHGYDHFRTHLVDHNTANDNGGWQWAASTGTDAQPYFRIFNPMTQGERYDPDAEYIKEWVPELAAASPDEIHGWHELGLRDRKDAAPEYPKPIVDHGERREQALAMYKRARGEDPDE
ncbi:cryptochrome/photolyase family protein [Natronomonas sp. EA1]|uniref:cryptochrome/photolyase family protein n=1 Tax=Natronomonas sp. EA1 TaxID=3421655 RepID=UPI003EBC30EF